MDNAAFVRRAHRVGERDRNVENPLEPQALKLNQVGQRKAVEKLERQERNAVVFLDRMDSDDVRMVERGGCARFAFESLQELSVARQLGTEHLQRDAPLQL
jgi:hypothetical protein